MLFNQSNNIIDLYIVCVHFSGSLFILNLKYWLDIMTEEYKWKIYQLQYTALDPNAELLYQTKTIAEITECERKEYEIYLGCCDEPQPTWEQLQGAPQPVGHEWNRDVECFHKLPDEDTEKDLFYICVLDGSVRWAERIKQKDE
jgi:hypothetical protein